MKATEASGSDSNLGIQNPVLSRPWVRLTVFALVNSLVLWAILAVVLIFLSSLLSATLGDLDALVGLNYLSAALIPVLILAELVLAFLVFLRIYRHKVVPVPKLVIFMVISAVGFGSLLAPGSISKFRYDQAKPIQLGTVELNLSQDNTINDRSSSKTTKAKNGLAISGNNIIWVEQTKENPPHAHNVWELFLFTFDESTSKGETIQLSESSKYKGKSPQSTVIDGNIVYWTNDGILFRYGIGSRETKIIDEDVASIHGVNGSYGLISRIDPEFDPSVYGAREKGIYLVEISTGKQTMDLSHHVTGSPISPEVNKRTYCAINYSNGEVTLIDIDSTPNPKTVQLPIPERSLGGGVRGIDILSCDRESIAYNHHSRELGDSLRLFSVEDSKEVIVEESIGSSQAKLMGNELYYSTKNNAVKLYTLNEGGKKEILSPSKTGNYHNQTIFWDVDGGYLTYLRSTGEYTKSVHLLKL